MKNHILSITFICSLLVQPLFAQDKLPTEVKTAVAEATVFLKGAQVVRKTTLAFPAGQTSFRFSQLSPYIDPKSVQLKVDGAVMTLSVNHQLNYNDTLKRSDEIERYTQQIKDLDEKITLEKTILSILNEETSFLRDNRKIGGTNNGVDFNNLKASDAYLSTRFNEIQMKVLDIGKKIKSLQEAKDLAQRNIAQAGNVKTEPTGEIIFVAETKTALKAPVELSYYVNNASWFPSYDIRAKTVGDPIEIVYKANVIQNTKEDWRDVRLTVSSLNPNLGNVAPKLIPYRLDYFSRPPRYNSNNLSNQAYGRVCDETGSALPGVSIMIVGTSIGTVSDVNGNFSISIPAGGGQLLFSYVGYENQTLPVSNTAMHVVMHEDIQQLDEVVVLGNTYDNTIYDDSYSLEKAMVGRAAGVEIRGVTEAPRPKAIALPTVKVENATSVEFLVDKPYTILSNNKNTVVEVERYEAPADYHYFCAPKADRDAFLLADIADWEQYNLLEGEANIFFENTFVGKTILDVRYMSDTLNLSLGRDKNVTVRREQVKEYTSKKALGTKAEATRGWRITVRNNKQQPVTMTLCDQIPVSTMSEIEVTPETLSDGILNKETGEVVWRFTLQPSQRKELNLKYRVRYPKGRTLNIE